MDPKLNITTSLDKICRTCLSENNELKSICENNVIIDNSETQMSYMLEVCTSIQIQSNDGLSNLICNNCEERLFNAYSFRKQALKSDETLRNCANIANFHQVKKEETIEIEPIEICDYFGEENTTQLYYLDEQLNDKEGVNTDKPQDNYKITTKRNDDSDWDLEKEKPIKKKRRGRKKGWRKSTKIDKRRTKTIVDSGLISQALLKQKQKRQTRKECQLCGFISSTTRGLSLHISHMHKEMKNRWCTVCYLEVDDIETHKSAHKLDRTYNCSFCEKSFRSHGHLTEHLRSHSDEKPFKCELCRKGFVSARHLRVHSRTHSGERPFECEVCEKRFSQKSALLNHQFLHRNEKLYKCKVCEKEYHELKDLADHIVESGHGEQLDVSVIKNNTNLDVPEIKMEAEEVSVPELCKEGDSIVKKEELDNTDHFKIFLKKCDNNDVDQKFIASELPENSNPLLNRSLCNVCGKTFSSQQKLRLHMRLHTGDTPYVCIYCTKHFCTRAQLVIHERIHTGEKPHVCHICGRGFAQSAVLNTHMRLHTGRPEQCNICGQRFCRPAELRLHMRKHTGEKPYLCTECGQAFIQASHLTEHLKRHSDVRPFPCPHCTRAFKHKASLRSHIQIHTGEKPYKCTYCAYACRQSYSLTQHMRQHTGNHSKPHECPSCSKRFASPHLMKVHVISVHSELIVP